MNALAPVLLGGDTTFAIQELLQRMLEFHRRLEDLLAEEEIRYPDQQNLILLDALNDMTGTVGQLDAQIKKSLDLGYQLLVALNQWPEAKPVKKLSESNVLARAIDQNLQSLKTLTRGLQEVRPDKVNFANTSTKPAAKARHGKGRKLNPDILKSSKERHLACSDIPQAKRETSGVGSSSQAGQSAETKSTSLLLPECTLCRTLVHQVLRRLVAVMWCLVRTCLEISCFLNVLNVGPFFR